MAAKLTCDHRGKSGVRVECRSGIEVLAHHCGLLDKQCTVAIPVDDHVLCKTCRFKTSPSVERAASSPRKPAKPRPPCANLGAETGATIECKTCSGRVQLKLMACSVHGTCTAGKKVEGTACCRDCPDWRDPTLTLCLAIPAKPGEPYEIIASEISTFAGGKWKATLGYQCERCGWVRVLVWIDRDLNMMWRVNNRDWTAPAPPKRLDGLAPIDATYDLAAGMVLFANGPPPDPT